MYFINKLFFVNDVEKLSEFHNAWFLVNPCLIEKFKNYKVEMVEEWKKGLRSEESFLDKLIGVWVRFITFLSKLFDFFSDKLVEMFEDCIVDFGGVRHCLNKFAGYV